MGDALTPHLLMVMSAAVLGAAGLALLFAPAELWRLAAAPDTALASPITLQLWAAALLGLGATNWIGRGLTLGDIYGRALVVGNLVHWTVGAFVGARAALDRPSLPVLWAGTGLYGVFALLFWWLLKRHPVRVPPAPP